MSGWIPIAKNIYYGDGYLQVYLGGRGWMKISLDELTKEEVEKANKEIRKKAEKKYLKEVQSELKAKLEEKKYSDRVRKHADAMLHELKHCRVNHPDDSWPWKSYDFVHQCSVMIEEAGEAVRAANTLRESSKGDLLSLYNELAQTGAMCLRIMEQIEDYALRLDKKSGA